MSSKINTGIFFAIATLTLMVAGTLYGGITNANAQQTNNIGNFASNTQTNSAVSVADASASATGGNGGAGSGTGGTGGVGGAAGAQGGTAVSAVSQSNTFSNTQGFASLVTAGVNLGLANGGAQTNNIGNFVTSSQSNSAVSVADASATATGGNGGAAGCDTHCNPCSNTCSTSTGTGGTGGAGGPATAIGGTATSAVSQSNTFSNTQGFLSGITIGANVGILGR